MIDLPLSVRLAGTAWDVTPAQTWPNVCWLTAPFGQVVVVYETRDGGLGSSSFMITSRDLERELRWASTIPFR